MAERILTILRKETWLDYVERHMNVKSFKVDDVLRVQSSERLLGEWHTKEGKGYISEGRDPTRIWKNLIGET